MNTLAAQAAARIQAGKTPENLVDRLHYGWCFDEDVELSSSITLADFRRGGYIETYRSLREIADGCWN